MTDRDRLARSLGRLAAARSAHDRRSIAAGLPDEDEIHAAHAQFEREARRAGLSRSDAERLERVIETLGDDRSPRNESTSAG
jgi:hypothetical protein